MQFFKEISDLALAAGAFVAAHTDAVEGALGTGLVVLMRLFPTKNPQGPFIWLANMIHKGCDILESALEALRSVADLLHKVEAILDNVVPQNVKPAVAAPAPVDPAAAQPVQPAA